MNNENESLIYTRYKTICSIPEGTIEQYGNNTKTYSLDSESTCIKTRQKKYFWENWKKKWRTESTVKSINSENSSYLANNQRVDNALVERSSHIVIKTGKCGDHVEWSLYEDGKLIIHGKGAMYDYKPETVDNGKQVAPWHLYRAKIHSVKVDKGITHLGQCAFAYCENIENVELFCVIEYMPWLSFFECKKLCEISVPKGVKCIQNDCFLECSSLRSVKLPDGVTEIGDSAFYNCRSLETINLPESLTDINEYAFAFCMKLKNIRIPHNTTYIHEKAFFKSGVTVRPRR